MTNRQTDTYHYRLADFGSAMLAWALFFGWRKWMEGVPLEPAAFHDLNFYYGIFIVPTGWFLFYSLFDDYRDIYRLARLSTIARTFVLSFIGVCFLFSTLLLDDVVTQFVPYWASFAVLFGLHFTITVTVRMVLLTRAHRRLKKETVFFPTLLIGGGERALQLYHELRGRKEGIGYRFAGYVADRENANGLPLTYLGRLDKMNDVIAAKGIEDVIIALDNADHDRLKNILNQLFDLGEKIHTRIVPDMYDIMLGNVRMNEVFGAALIQIKQELMPKWERLLKRLMDVTASAGVLVLLSPVLLLIMLRVRLSSPGPIFYRQERIGLDGKPFHLVKFRSMYVDAEAAGPQLSSENDPRITPWGLTMRRYRLDELPNFWNVLVGDMSLVGPRPERQFFINQIVEQEPHYRQLMKVRPGITSWGQVKYGYASNVDEMLQRLKFDILYIENMSLMLDLKIIFYTVLVLVEGKGK